MLLRKRILLTTLKELSMGNKQIKDLIRYQNIIMLDIIANERRRGVIAEDNELYESWKNESESIMNAYLDRKGFPFQYDSARGDVMAFIENLDISMNQKWEMADFAEKEILPLRKFLDIPPLEANAYKAFYEYGIPLDLDRNYFVADKVFRVYESHVRAAKRKF